ncbi:hypothetical protein ZIOFF_006866 [Zingiber officinale]|uniref:NADP-dependent oxidoreductase domain-containing protein n=2 Tax=Zingiber officinale TaxID=94328 RepID=A0A8J5M351_ZINOF|nr:hypothetical protein ZIOFF_006866 [Zingiber officinale]
MRSRFVGATTDSNAPAQTGHDVVQIAKAKPDQNEPALASMLGRPDTNAGPGMAHPSPTQQFQEEGAMAEVVSDHRRMPIIGLDCPPDHQQQGAMAEVVTLRNGHSVPVIGIGVSWLEPQSIRDLILSALNIGYRHFDCAANYHIEAEVGEALAEAFLTGLVKREEVFITTKLWNSDHGHVLDACKDSLKKLNLQYLDLYLVHFPVATRHTGIGTSASAFGDDGVLDIDTTISLETTWHAMEELVNLGLVRSIGISNYDIFLTRDCLAYSKIKPSVIQIEIHPYFQRESLIDFCQKHGICVTAHTPLSGGTANTQRFGTMSCLDDPVIKSLAEKYNKTASQLILKWGIQRNTVVIPKTSKIERLHENFKVFDFTIHDEDMKKMKDIDRKYRTNQPAKFWGIDLYA